MKSRARYALSALLFYKYLKNNDIYCFLSRVFSPLSSVEKKSFIIEKMNRQIQNLVIELIIIIKHIS